MTTEHHETPLNYLGIDAVWEVVIRYHDGRVRVDGQRTLGQARVLAAAYSHPGGTHGVQSVSINTTVYGS